MNKKKIYIAGSGGMLGEAFYRVFKDEYLLKCTDIDENDKWISYLDFNNYEKYLVDVKNFNPDYLFHLGALTDLEYCEENINHTYLTNTISVEYAVKISNILDIPLLFISTAGIFDGSKNQYDDWDMPKPLCYYAKSKYAAEKFVQLNKKKYIICRAGWMMGAGPKKDKKFINKLAKQIIDGSKVLHIVNDKLGTPTYTIDFAKNIKLILENEIWGLYNLVCAGKTSRVNVAMEMLKILNIEKNISIKEVNSDYFKSTYYAPRPDSEQLINRKLQILNMDIMRDWKIALKEYLEIYYSHLMK